MKTAYAVKNPVTPKVRPAMTRVAEELQRLQRKRTIVLKSRNMNANRLQAVVAVQMGYSSALGEKQREKYFGEASKVIAKIEEQAFTREKGQWSYHPEAEIDHPLGSIIIASLFGIHALEVEKEKLEKVMREWAAKLHVAKWVERADQRGFGILFLAIVVGECGDLAGYANPGKVWRRMGCAPYTNGEGEVHMGATWKAGKEGKLTADEWSDFGYSPRRRSIAYLIGEGIVKQNGDGPYRKRYDSAKEAAAENHPDWKPLRCHLHGMLLGTKLLLKNLWIEWNK